jgi:hypothetical protein
MADQIRILALYKDIETAAKGTDLLEEMGKSSSEVEVVTGSPINPEMLGRPHPHSRVPRFALAGAVTGFFLGILLAFVTPRLYELNVGGKPLSPGAPSVVVIFEMTMLLMLVFTFLGVFLESNYPSFKKKEYVPQISDGDIAFLFSCAEEQESDFAQNLVNGGAESVTRILEEDL